MSSRYTSAVLGSSPWSGPRTGEGLGGYGPDPVRVQKYHGHAAEAIGRRTEEERAEILRERLEQLRARPPFNSPFHTASPA